LPSISLSISDILARFKMRCQQAVQLVLALAYGIGTLGQEANCPAKGTFDSSDYPALNRLIDQCHDDKLALVEELKASPIAGVSKYVPAGKQLGHKASATANLPIVSAHGMGDSCFNAGMKSITEEAGAEMGVYSVCIPTGDDRISDTINGFFLNMDASVDVFATKVRADPKLAQGFNAFGLSQGNNLIRGYIAKYNDPPVHTFLSVNGINAGVGAFPDCSPQGKVVGSACEALSEVLGQLAYNPIAQGVLFQADYFRDPSKTNTSQYKTYSQLAQWNNEGDVRNSTLNEGFAKTDQFVWVLGTEDTVVWPREGEWWGAMDPSDPWHTVLPMNETEWYREDLFGLRTADEAGKNHFESFQGNHLGFTTAEFLGWIDEYFGTPA